VAHVLKRQKAHQVRSRITGYSETGHRCFAHTTPSLPIYQRLWQTSVMGFLLPVRCEEQRPSKQAESGNGLFTQSRHLPSTTTIFFIQYEAISSRDRPGAVPGVELSFASVTPERRVPCGCDIHGHAFTRDSSLPRLTREHEAAA
jgi:hypothetical protein